MRGLFCFRFFSLLKKTKKAKERRKKTKKDKDKKEKNKKEYSFQH